MAFKYFMLDWLLLVFIYTGNVNNKSTHDTILQSMALTDMSGPFLVTLACLNEEVSE